MLASNSASFALVQEFREQFVCERQTTEAVCLSRNKSVKLEDCSGGLEEFSKCRRAGATGIVCFEAGTACIEKNDAYAQCLRPGFTRRGWTLNDLDGADTEPEP